MNKKKKTILIWGVVLSPFLFVFFLVSLASLEFFGPLPTFDQLENPKNNLATEVISSDSVVIGKFFIDNRTTAKNEDIPQSFINALLATEDIRFREHSGNLMSSVARSALTKFCGISSCLAEVRFSKKYFPKTTLSAEMISVAKLFLGFSN